MNNGADSLVNKKVDINIRTLLENQDCTIINLYDSLTLLVKSLEPTIKGKVEDFTANIGQPVPDEHCTIFNTIAMNNIRLENLRIKIMELNCKIEV